MLALALAPTRRVSRQAHKLHDNYVSRFWRHYCDTADVFKSRGASEPREWTEMRAGPVAVVAPSVARRRPVRVGWKPPTSEFFIVHDHICMHKTSSPLRRAARIPSLGAICHANRACMPNSRPSNSTSESHARLELVTGSLNSPRHALDSRVHSLARDWWRSLQFDLKRLAISCGIEIRIRTS